VRLYLTVARHSFRRYSTYRVATAAGAFTNTVFGLIRAFVLIALWRNRTTIGGYDVTDAVTFCFLSQALMGPVDVFGGSLDLAERIRTGDIAIDLYRPVDLQAWWLATDAGRAAFHLLGRGLPPMLLGALAFRLRFPPDAAAWVGTGCSVALAILVAFGIRYLVGLAAFWLLDDRGLTLVAATVAQFFSGLLVPLVLVPGWLGALAKALPWASTMQVPIDIWLGQHRGADLVGALGQQALWALALLAVGRAIGAAAHRKVVVQGG
jgi:viologen exporter family transport system permease protein